MLAVFCAFAAGMLARYGLQRLQSRAIRGRLLYPDGVFLARRRMRLTDQGVAIEAAAYGNRFAWTAIHEVTASAGLVILWIEPVAACIVPASAFKDEAEMQSFIGYAGRQIAMARPNAQPSPPAEQD